MKHKFYDFKDVRNYLSENFAYNIPDYAPPPELSGRLIFFCRRYSPCDSFCYEIDQDETDAARWSQFLSRFYFKMRRTRYFLNWRRQNNA